MDDHPLQIAEGYPFPRPSSCFLYANGGVHPLPDDWRSGERAPVLAIGANAAPRRLAQKFLGPHEAVPVTRAALHDHAVVFSAHYSSYGSLPATIWPWPGALTQVFVTWLDATQLERMHQSEGVGSRYRVSQVERVELKTRGHEGNERAEAYISTAGALAPRGQPIRLAELRALNCPLEARSQPAMLREMYRFLAPGEPYQTFMAEVVTSKELRERLRERLAAIALRA